MSSQNKSNELEQFEKEVLDPLLENTHPIFASVARPLAGSILTLLLVTKAIVPPNEAKNFILNFVSLMYELASSFAFDPSSLLEEMDFYKNALAKLSEDTSDAGEGTKEISATEG